MSAASDCGLIIFLRLPEKGKVKTRLAQSLGDEMALHIYQQLTALTLRLASDSGFPAYLFYEGGLPFSEDRIPTFNYHLQTDGDLGEKMMDAFSMVLSVHSQAIIIGSDCPFLNKNILAGACESLKHNDIVIGPAEDGGYYLLGCKKMYSALFQNKSWSTSVVYEQTIETIRDLHLMFHSLDLLKDIDTAKDWAWYQKQIS